MPQRFSPIVRDRAVHLVRSRMSASTSETAAITSVASDTGAAVETIRRWIRAAHPQSEIKRLRSELNKLRAQRDALLERVMDADARK